MLKGKLRLHPDFRSISWVTPANEKRKKGGLMMERTGVGGGWVFMGVF